MILRRSECKSGGSHFFISFATHKIAAVGGSNHSEGVTCEYDRSGGAKVQRTLPPSLHPAYPRRAISNGFNSGCHHRFYPASQKLHRHCHILFLCGKLTPFVMGQSSREIPTGDSENVWMPCGESMERPLERSEAVKRVIKAEISVRANVPTHKQKYGQLAGLQVQSQN